jgi:tetratricopeptide (TPR) repeat protein
MIIRSVAIAATLLLSPLAQAGVADEARELMGQAKYAEALQVLDGHLAKNPQDAEARFTRGLVLVKLNRSDDAVKVFSALTRDYPQLPEPYNNLAVLYAQQGNYEKARDALEAALATHPSYPTAHENLGDIYAALAGAAYNRALMLDQSNTIVRHKLNLIGQLDHVPASATSATRSSARSAAPAAPVAAPLEATTPASSAEAEAINSLLLAWTSSWSSQDLSAYFNCYADDFAPEGGLSRASWQGQRRERITRPKRIAVRAVSPEVAMAGSDRARLSFIQEYESDTFNDQVPKVLELKLVDGNWKITREYTR